MNGDPTIPSPHNGGRCPASSDGGVGFYTEEPLETGFAVVVCPNGCGWWREFDPLTREVVDGDHAALDSGRETDRG